MNWYKTAKEVSNEYSWTYVNLPSKIVDTLIGFGKEIDPDDLYVKEAEDGLELDPHITVKYAILTNEFKDVKDLLNGEKGGKFHLGESTIFENDKFDVVKIEVESDDLLRLHEKINYLPHEDRHSEYHAHATIAYVKPGKGKKYVGKFKINKSFSFDEIFFGDQDKKDHKIKLANNFNLLLCRYAQIWNIDIGEDFEDKIAALYELEYKYSMVRDRFQGMPKRQENILDEIGFKLNDVLEEVKNILVEVFGDWLKKHALLSADTWSRGRVEAIDTDDVDHYDAYNALVQEYMRYAIYGGSGRSPTDEGAYDRFSNEMIEKAKDSIGNFPLFSKALGYSLQGYREMLMDDLSSEGFEEFGSRMGKKFENDDQAEKYIYDLSIEDVDVDSLFYGEGIKAFVDMVENIGLFMGVLEEFYKNFVFPHWVEYWASKGIEGTRENVENVYKQLQQISSNDIRGALAVISAAIQTTHQTGEMMDYVSNHTGTSMGASELISFLKEMSSGSKTEEWNQQLREIGVNI